MLELRFDDVRVAYKGRTVLDGITASMRGGEVVAVLGRNGSGKTTLLKAAAGLAAHQGRIELREDGKALPGRSTAYLPQLAEVRSRLTVFEMVMLGLVRDLGWRVSDAVLEQVDATLHLMHIERHANDPVASLSGGQKQLVFMAQAFVSNPRALLLDEPTSALDLRHQLIVMEAARAYARRSGAVVAAVVHDLFLAARFADRLLMIEDGRVRAFDEPAAVLTPEMIDDIYHVDAAVEKSSLGWLHVIPKRARFLPSDHAHPHVRGFEFFDEPEDSGHDHPHDHAHGHDHRHAHDHDDAPADSAGRRDDRR